MDETTGRAISGWHPVAAPVVVVEQEATWPQAPAPAEVATVFTVSDGRISTVLRFEALARALQQARRPASEQ